VSGEVRNAGSNPWDDLVVVALWYDSSGGLITTSTAIINDLPFQTAAILSFAVESSGRAAVQLDRCDVEFRSGGLLIAKTTESLPELAMRVEPSPTAIPRPTPATGDWVTGFYTDPLTRVTAYNASLTAEVGSNFVDTPYSMSILGCGDDLKDAIIAIEWGEYIASGESVTVTYRIDERDLEEDSGWFTSSAGDSTYKFRNTRQMIESLSSGAQFIARVTPYNDASVTGVWDLEGIEEVANTIADTCNW